MPSFPGAEQPEASRGGGRLSGGSARTMAITHNLPSSGLRNARLTTSEEFSVRFWGVRGSIACCSADYARYGGNTSCVEIRCGDRVLIFDAGTGIRPLGKQLVQSLPANADIFFTHTHLDHIVGLPFFAPLYKPGSKIR